MNLLQYHVMKSISFNKLIGARVRKLRRVAPMTQGELAKTARLSRSAIASIETGRQAMTAYQIYSIATALKLKNIDVLFDLPDFDYSGEEEEMLRKCDLNETQRQQLSAIIESS